MRMIQHQKIVIKVLANEKQIVVTNLWRATQIFYYKLSTNYSLLTEYKITYSPHF